MTKEEFLQWLEKRIATQNKLVLAAALAMAIAAIPANYLEYRVLQFITGFYLSWAGTWIVSLSALLILVALNVVTWLRMPTNLSDSVYTAIVKDAEVPVHVAPPMGIVWTFALGSIESDRTWMERIMGILALPQRLACASFYLFRRVQQFGIMDVNNCASVIRLLYRHNERVEVTTIASKHPDLDLTVVLRELSLIDGITFLPRQNVGVALAPRLTEELNNLTGPQPGAAP